MGLCPPPQEPVFRWEPWRSGAEAVEESALVIAAGGGGSLGVVGVDAWGHTNPQAPSLSAQQMRALSSILRGFQDGHVQWEHSLEFSGDGLTRLSGLVDAECLLRDSSPTCLLSP